MACIQIFSSRSESNGSSSATPQHLGPMFGYAEWQDDLAEPGVPWLVTGTFRNVLITHASAPGAGNSFVYTFVKNFVDTALTITIADSAVTGSDLTHAVSVVPGDVVYWKRVSVSTPTVSNVKFSGEFWGQVAGESGYGGLGAFNETLSHRGPVFNQGQFNTGAGGALNHEVVAVAGTLTRIAIRLAAGPGAGASYEIAIYKNDVKQDGTGGTIDTRIVIANAATTGSWTGSLALVPGDYVYFNIIPTNSPASASVSMGCGVKFVATTDGESHGGQLVFFNLPGPGGPYYARADSYHAAGGWDATESVNDTFAPPVTTATIYGLRVKTGSSIAVGPATFALRRSGATTALTATLTAGQSSGADTVNSFDLGPGDTWSMQYTRGGSAGTTTASFAFVVFALNEPSLAGCAVFGVTTRVTGNRAVGFGLDGNVNVHSRNDTLKIFGNLEVTGETLLSGATVIEGLGEHTTDTTLTSAQVLALRGSPATVVSAPGAGLLLEFIGGMLYLDAGAAAYVESSANLAIRYGSGTGVQVSQTIEATGFIDQTADTTTSMVPRVDAIAPLSGSENQPLVLHNLGAAEYTVGDGVLLVFLAYRLWPVAVTFVSTSPSASASPSASPSITPSPSASLSPSASASPSASPSITPSPSISRSPSASASPSASLSPSASVSRSPSASASPSPSVSPSASPSVTPSASVSRSPSPSTSPSASPSRSPSPSLSPSASVSPSLSPSEGGGGAGTLWVNGSTGNDANSRAAVRAGGGSVQWRTIGRAAWGSTNRASPVASEAAAAGDTVSVAAGTYTTDTFVDNRQDPVYNPVNQGSAGNYITFVADGQVRLGARAANSPVIGAFERNYIKWYADITQGDAWLITCDGRVVAPDTKSDPNICNTKPDTGPITAWGCTGTWLEGININGGPQLDWDDNFNGIRIEGGHGTVVRNCTIYSFHVMTTTSHNATCITLYNSVNCLIEHNDLSDAPQGFYFKDTSPNTLGNNTVRFNHFHDVICAVRWSQQNGPQAGNYVYQNLMTDCEFGFTYNADGWDDLIYNNTLYNLSATFIIPGNLDGVRCWNNIIHTTPLVIYKEGTGNPPVADLNYEHNCYYSAPDHFLDEGGTLNFAAYKAAYPGQDDDSPISIATDPQFVSVAGGNFRLGASSPCRNLGRHPQTSATMHAGCYQTMSEEIGLES